MDAKTARICYEDFEAGSVRTFGPRLVTREEIVEFASEFDPQPMHLDEEAANKSMLKGLSSSWDPLESTCRHASLSIL